MKIRLVVKLAVTLSVILFCIGMGFYGFARLSVTDGHESADMLDFVPGDSYGLFESDNVDYFMHEFPVMAYASQLDTLQRAGLFDDVLNDLNRYSSTSAHGLSSRMNHLLVSFHSPGRPDMVAYFLVGKEEKKKLIEAVRKKHGVDFVPKEETYRGEKIEIYPVSPTKYLSVYTKDGVLAMSYQKRLIEKVIDARKNHTSLNKNVVFSSVYRPKPVRHATIYGRTASLPFLSDGLSDSWSDFDIHLNSEVFYLSGAMFAPDSCMQTVNRRLLGVPSFYEKDSVLVVAGQHRVDSCISEVSASVSRSLFDECVANLSHDASYIMVADMDWVLRHPEDCRPYLPGFVLRHPGLFRSFILSVQVTRLENRFSHIFVFTYKD